MAQEHFHKTSLLKPAAQGVGWVFQLRCPDHFAHTACFPALNHGPDSPPLLCTIHYSPSSAAAKQLYQQHLAGGNMGKQQWHCPYTVTFSVSNKRKVIPVLEAVRHPKTTDTRYSLEVFSVGSQVFWGQQCAHVTLEWPLSGTHCKHNAFVHGNAGFVTCILHDIWVQSRTVPEKFLGSFL